MSIVPSARGIKSKLGSELGDELEDAGTKAGKAGGQKASGSFADTFKKAIVAAGIGTVLISAFSSALDTEALNDKLAGQLGLTEEQSAAFGRAAGDLYAHAYGDSLAQVNDALAGVQHNLGELAGADEDALTRAAGNALNLASAFDQDVGPATAAVAQLMRTGLASSADEAFDIITRGFQLGVDKSGDFLDTITEYSTQFRKVGLDAGVMTGLLTQGLQAGARDADIVADAIKEFSIRAVDGSKLTAEGFEMVGLSGETMSARIAAGGPDAAAALDETLDRLRAIEDPVLRSQAAVALFGTQAEDLGDALFALDPSTAVEGLGDVAGAAATLGDTLAGNTKAKIEAFKRQALQGIANFVGKYVIPAIEKIAPIVGRFLAALVPIGAWIVEHKPVLIAVAGAIAGPLVAAFIAWAVAAATAAVSTLIALAPLILIGAAIALAAYLIITHWDTIKAAFSAAARWIGDRIGEIVGFFVALPGRIVGYLVTVRDWIVERFRAARDSVLGFLGGIAQWFRDLPGNIVSWVGNLGSVLYEAGKDLIKGLVRGILNGPSVADAINKKLGPFSGQIGGILNVFGRASGGDVWPGQPFIVGEEGPEIFWPSMRGTVIPNSVTSSVLAAGPSVAPVLITGNTFLGTKEETARWLADLVTRGQAARERRGGSLPLRSTRR